jgi:hypothetical protein
MHSKVLFVAFLTALTGLACQAGPSIPVIQVVGGLPGANLDVSVATTYAASVRFQAVDNDPSIKYLATSTVLSAANLTRTPMYLPFSIPGLSFSTVTTNGYDYGLISGTAKIPATHVYAVRLDGTNSAGTGSAVMTLYIFAPPAIVAMHVPHGKSGQPYDFGVPSGNGPNFYTWANLPAFPGVVGDTTGLLEGTAPIVTKSTNFNVPYTLTNPAGATSGTLTVTIDP